MREAINREDETVCVKCGNPIANDANSNICEYCADDLRTEREAEAEDYFQRQRELHGEQ